MLNSLVKAAAGVALYQTGKYLARRDVEVKGLSNDGKFVTAITCLFASGVLICKAINEVIDEAVDKA